MGRPVTAHLTETQQAGVDALYAETAAHEAYLRTHTAETRYSVYMGDAMQAIGVMRRNAHEGKALMDIEAGSAWDEATGALRNAGHVFTREWRDVPAAQAREIAAARAQVSSLLREAGATLRTRQALEIEASDEYRAEQFARNAGRRHFQVAGRAF